MKTLRFWKSLHTSNSEDSTSSRRQTRYSWFLKIIIRDRFRWTNHQKSNAFFRFFKFDIKHQRYQKIDKNLSKTFAFWLHIFARTQHKINSVSVRRISETLNHFWNLSHLAESISLKSFRRFFLKFYLFLNHFISIRHVYSSRIFVTFSRRIYSTHHIYSTHYIYSTHHIYSTYTQNIQKYQKKYRFFFGESYTNQNSKWFQNK